MKGVAMRRKRNDQTRGKPGQPQASGLAAGQRLAQQDIDASADELVSFLRRWADVWPRREKRDWSAFYFGGPFAHLARKSLEPSVVRLKEPAQNASRGLLPFINQSNLAVWSKRQSLLAL